MLKRSRTAMGQRDETHKPYGIPASKEAPQFAATAIRDYPAALSDSLMKRVFMIATAGCCTGCIMVSNAKAFVQGSIMGCQGNI